MRVRNNGTKIRGVCIANGPVVRLMPGVNQTDPKYDAEIRRNGGFKRWEDVGLVEVLGESDTTGKLRKASAVVEEVRDVDDVKTLEAIRKADPRASVQSAIEERMALLKSEPKKAGE